MLAIFYCEVAIELVSIVIDEFKNLFLKFQLYPILRQEVRGAMEHIKQIKAVIAPPAVVEKNVGQQGCALKSMCLETPLGKMIAIADENCLYLLEFLEQRNLEKKIEALQLKTKSSITYATNEPLLSIAEELMAYFKGTLQEFKTPLYLTGTAFQNLAWTALMRIPYGEIRSYAEQAEIVRKPTAYRAIANANGANQLAIVIPCHRIINSDGKIGGYGGGIERKRWLIDHEKNTNKSEFKSKLLKGPAAT